MRVLVLTTVEDDDVVYAALGAGASGFLLKSVPRERLWARTRGLANAEIAAAYESGLVRPGQGTA